jgi:mRNA interferase RelE/StbE
MYSVRLTARAMRDLDKIYSPDLPRIKSHILSLETNPRPHGVIKLKEHLHRIRVGDWRILYAIEDDKQMVTILRVLRRSKRTYKKIY